MGYLKDFSDRFIKKRSIVFLIKLPMLSNCILVKNIFFLANTNKQHDNYKYLI